MSDEGHNPPGGGPTYHQEVQHSPATARVPERVGMGVFSTGTIVMHGPHDFVIDFLQSLAHPRRVAARVVLPPTVVPLFLAAMQDNFNKYTQTFGPLPRMPVPHPPQTGPGAPPAHSQGAYFQGSQEFPPQFATGHTESSDVESNGSGTSEPPSVSGGQGGSGGHGEPPRERSEDNESAETPFPLEHPTPHGAPGFMGSEPPHNPPPVPAPPPISEVYEQLKLPDDMLSGNYANTVVISHSGAEFCFDFITSFYPRSAVAVRVYMACPHVVELFESLTRSWGQFRQRGR